MRNSKKHTEEPMLSIPLHIYNTARSLDDIEDWLWSHNKNFIGEMRNSQKLMLQGKGVSLKELKRKFDIK